MTMLLVDAFHWLLNLLEVILVITAILVLGLVSVVVPLWVLGKLGRPPAEPDSDTDEVEGGSADQLD